ncbi:MAG: ZrgA family zinc uptake protein [Pseudobdellovibrio sp.]
MKNSVKMFIFAAGLILSISAGAAEKVHREHGAHQHGSGTLAIAFDDIKGRLELKVPGDSTIGFEYVPKTKKDIATQKNQLDKLEKNIGDIVVFDPSLKCKVSQAKVEEVSEKDHPSHSETHADFDILCEKSPLKTSITFNFQKYFPKIKDMDVQVLIGDLQKSLEANKNGTVVELK